MKRIGFALWIAAFLLGMQTVAADELKRYSIGAAVFYYDIEPGKLGDADREFDSTVLWEAELSYQLTKSLSLALHGGLAQTELTVSHDEQSGGLGELTQESLFLTARYRFPVTNFPSWIYLGVGGGYLRNDLSNYEQAGTQTFFALNRTLSVKDGYGLLLNAGVTYFPMPDVSISLDIRSIFTKADITLTTPGTDPIENEMSMNTSAFGLRIHYHF